MSRSVINESVMTLLQGNYRDILSTVLGNASMLFWMIAQIPQLYKNYKTGSVKALSRVFLSIWLIGDLLNLSGSILTQQQPFQIRLAAYFVTIDVIMLIQYVLLCNKTFIPLLKSNSSLLLLITPVSAYSSYSVNSARDYQIGLLLSWICAILYLTSRIPQILLNYKNQSVHGLSLEMFFCAFMGNLTYSVSLLLFCDTPGFWMKSTPFLVGSMGTLIQDLFIFLQSYLYSDNLDVGLWADSTDLEESQDLL